MRKLKPCPFCGHKPIVYNQSGLIICAYSMCGVNPESKSKECWNSRATENKQQNEIIEYKAFMFGLKLSSEDEARMLRMFDKYKKGE